MKDEWENLSHPVLIEKVQEQITDEKIDLSAIDHNVRKIRNPFAKIANHLGAEPKKRRPLTANVVTDFDAELESENTELPAETVSLVFTEADVLDDSDTFENDESSSTIRQRQE